MNILFWLEKYFHSLFLSLSFSFLFSHFILSLPLLFSTFFCHRTLYNSLPLPPSFFPHRFLPFFDCFTMFLVCHCVKQKRRARLTRKEGGTTGEGNIKSRASFRRRSERCTRMYICVSIYIYSSMPSQLHAHTHTHTHIHSTTHKHSLRSKHLMFSVFSFFLFRMRREIANGLEIFTRACIYKAAYYLFP